MIGPLAPDKRAAVVQSDLLDKRQQDEVVARFDSLPQ